MSVSVGDATLTFLGDTTRLDTTLNSIGPKTKAALAPAQDAASDLGDSLDAAGKQGEESFKRVGKSARGATEQVRFLGEEVGVRLPRAMSKLIAELPGVGTAMGAAFNAVAIIFFAKMLIDATDKLSKFIAARVYNTAAIDEQNRKLAEEGKIIVSNVAAVKAATDEYLKLSDTRKPIEKLKDALAANVAETEKLGDSVGLLGLGANAVSNSRLYALRAENRLLQEQIALQEKADKEAADAKQLASLKQEITLRKQLAETQVTFLEVANGLNGENADEMRYKISLQALRAQLAAEKSFGKDSINNQKEISAQIAALEINQGKKTVEALKQQQNELLKDQSGLLESFAGQLKQYDVAIDSTLKVDKMQQYGDAASKLGITLGVNLKYAAQQAALALAELRASGLATPVELKAGEAAAEQAAKAYRDLGKSTNEFKLKTSEAWREFMNDTQNGKNAMESIKQISITAFTDIQKNIQGAFASVVLGEGNVAKALEKSVAQSLASIASQAAVKALYYTAEGFAALAGWEDQSASQYFMAAGEMAAVAGAAGIAGRAMSGGSGGSGGAGGSGVNANNPNSNNQVFQYGSSVSNTGSQAGSGRTTTVQGFATGALITRPTLAMFAEKGPEVAIPLNDPQAKKAVNEALGGADGGTHNHFHINVNGMISPDNLSKTMKKMSRAVSRGQATLTASNSQRITKR